MNKFQKLSQLNKDIELLENAGKIKAADILHKKFIKEAQYAMPQVMTTMMPQMFMPQMMPMMPQMFARPAVNPLAVAKPATTPATVVKPATAPVAVAKPTTTPVAVAKQTTAPTGTATGVQNPPNGITYEETMPKPYDMGIQPPPAPPPTTVPYDKYKNFYYDQQTGKDVFVDPIEGKPFENQNDIPKEMPAPVQPPTSPPARQITPPNERQNQLGNFFKGKIDKFFITNPKPSIEDQYTFIGNLEDQLRQYRDNGNLTEQQYQDLTNKLYVR